MKPNIEWTDDCQGKKDYDGSIICISTRYWPRGGGFNILDTSKLKWEDAWQGNESRPEIKPSAKASLYINQIDDDGSSEYIDLASQEFEADTEEEVKIQVEKWVEDIFNSVVNLIITKYPIPIEDIEN